jgi:hypothetical protein
MGKTNITLEVIKEELYKLNPNLIILSEIYTSWYDDIQVQCKIDNFVWITKWANIKKNPFSCKRCKENKSKKEIIDYITINNYKFIDFDSFDFINSKIIIQCNNHEPYKVNFKDFKAGRRCRICWNKQVGMQHANPLEKVLDAFKVNNYEILDGINTYKNARSVFVVKCKNGHISNMSYWQLIHNKDCLVCSDYISKYTYEKAYEVFQSFNCYLLTPKSEYIDSHQYLHYECICGHNDYDTVFAIKERKSCRKCAGYYLKLSKIEVDKIFKNRDCIPILTQEYYNRADLIDYKCVCGNFTHTTITDFNKIQGCSNCYTLRKSGENSIWWNPNLTDEERLDNRKYLEYKQWRKDVYKKDNYTCQCCGDSKGGNLNAHHKDGYSWCEERRLDINNGITLCENCHSLDINSFHKQFGFYNNTELQFNQWMNQNKTANYKQCASL